MNTEVIFFIREMDSYTNVFSIVLNGKFDIIDDIEPEIENIISKYYINTKHDISNWNIIEFKNTKKKPTIINNFFDLKINYRLDSEFYEKIDSHFEAVLTLKSELIDTYKEQIRILEDINSKLKTNVKNLKQQVKDLTSDNETKNIEIFKLENDLNENELNYLVERNETSYFKISAEQAKKEYREKNNLKYVEKKDNYITTELSNKYIDVLGYKVPIEYFQDYIVLLTKKITYQDTFSYEKKRCELHQRLFSVANLDRTERDESDFAREYNSMLNRIIDNSIKCICGSHINHSTKYCLECTRLTDISDYLQNLELQITK